MGEDSSCRGYQDQGGVCVNRFKVLVRPGGGVGDSEGVEYVVILLW